MASSKKAKVCIIPEENLSDQRVEHLLGFLDLTPFQLAKVPLFFSKNNDVPLETYRDYIRELISHVTKKSEYKFTEEDFTEEYSIWPNHRNKVPKAVEKAMEKEHRLIDLNGEPNLVLQKLAVCLEYCRYDIESPGKVYEAYFDVLGRFDDAAFDILMREKGNIKVAVLKDIVKYFEPSYWLENAQKYGIGEGVELTSYKIMKKLIKRETVESNNEGGDEEDDDEEEDEE